jgi:two-component system, chemotaxis family, chemotaxis protein CheY
VNDFEARATHGPWGWAYVMALDILVVDDSATIRKILQRVLTQTDLVIGSVKEAGDGVEALKALEANKPSLVLCDINMPNMDGLQLLTAVRARAEWSDVRFIMITTEGSPERVMEAVRLGASGYVRKPFTADEMKEKIAACVNGLVQAN